MQNLKIGTKILSVVILLALVSVGAVAFSALRMMAIDATYSTLLDGPVSGAVSSIRANRVLVQANADFFNVIAEQDPAITQQLAAALDADHAKFQELMADAVAKLPDRPELKDFETQFEALFEKMKRAAALGVQNKNDEAMALYHAEIEEPSKALAGAMFAANERTLKKVDDDSTASSDSVRAAIFVTATAVGVGLIIALGLAIAVSVGGITRPIGAMTRAMKALAGGDKTTEVPGRGRRDELGNMAEAVQVFKDNMIETDRLRDEQEQAKARAEADRRQSMLDLATRFESSVGGIVNGVTSAATELQSTAQSMSATAEQTTRQSSAVAAASEETTQNVQTVASATEELSASIGEITSQVSESTRIVSEAVAQASDTNAKVQGLSEAAQRIGDVVRLINDIASQTNLLALNATIEAARAGEAGKGFAVVASEVKTLATQTAKATDEIAGQVRTIQEATSSSAEAIENITRTIGRVSEISTAIASAVEEQGAATQEISRNVQQAAQGTQQVSSNITGVTQAAQQTGAAASEVLNAAGELGRNGEMLKVQVNEFLRTVRAG